MNTRLEIASRILAALNLNDDNRTYYGDERLADFALSQADALIELELKTRKEGE